MNTNQQVVGRILFTESQIAEKISALAARLNRQFENKNPIFVCVLRGAVLFYADLCRQMDCVIDMDFIAVSSYGDATKSSGTVRLVKDLTCSIEGRDVVIVEDIIDSGLTMQYLKNLLYTRKPASITTVALLSKRAPLENGLGTDYYGFEIGEEYLIGYGLDYHNSYRNLPYIAQLAQS